MREWLNAQVPGKPIGGTTLEALITHYLRTDAFKGLRSGTQDLYRRYLGQLRERAGNVPVEMITPAWIERLKLGLQDQPGKCNHTLTMLKILLPLGVRLGYCKTNAAKEVSLARVTPRTDIWMPEQVEAFLASAPPSLRLAMGLLLYTAQRPSDVLAMTLSRVSERDGRLYIALRQQKTGELLDVPVHRSLAPLLRERLSTPSNSLLLVPSPRGFQWVRQNFQRAWDAAKQKAGLPELQRRDLRRTAVVMMAQAGLSIGQISAITGHRIEKTAAILNRYLPRRTEVALSGMELWEQAPPAQLSNIVSLAATRGKRGR